MPTKPAYIRKTYYGLAALVISILSALFLAAHFEVSQLNITPDTFYFWNNITLLISCISGPLAVILAVIGYTPNDSKTLSVIAIVLIALPFAILFIQMMIALNGQL